MLTTLTPIRAELVETSDPAAPRGVLVRIHEPDPARAEAVGELLLDWLAERLRGRITR